MPAVALLAAVMAAMLSGCATNRLKHLDGETFVKQAEQIEEIHSAHWTRYIGVSGTRAYLESGDMFGLLGRPRTIVYWTELDGLPPSLVERLRAGDSVWTHAERRRGR